MEAIVCKHEINWTKMTTINYPQKEQSSIDARLAKLSAAIQAGDEPLAKEIVQELTELKLKLDIHLNKEDSEQRCKEKEFSVRVHIEDRVSDGCYINLMVKACDTIEDLKKKVFLKFNFPIEVQRWIIGKKIFQDKDKLGQCGVKGPGHTIYLYLVTARSVGLIRKDEPFQQAMSEFLQASNIREIFLIFVTNKLDEYLTLGEHGLWPQAELQSRLSSHSPVSQYLAQGPGEDLTSMLGRQGSKKSLSSGSPSFVQIPDYLANSSPVPQQTDRGRPKSVGAEIVAPSEAGPERRGGQRSRTPSTTPPRTPPVESGKNEFSSAGWQCETCTLINLPLRPGCEACAAPRPATYRVPAGYQMTSEEQLMFEAARRSEQMTREETTAGSSQQPQTRGQRGSQSAMERDQQELNRALQSYNLMNPDEENNEILPTQLVVVPGGADWNNIREVGGIPPEQARPSASRVGMGLMSALSNYFPSSVVYTPPKRESHFPRFPSPPQARVSSENSEETASDEENSNAEEETVRLNFLRLKEVNNLDLVSNLDDFTCPICFEEITAGEGIMLRDCLHTFCRECLTEAVRHCEDAVVRCPFQDAIYSCESVLQEREIKALVPQDLYLKFLKRGLDQAESQTPNAYHCKTTDCPGWCVYEDLVNFFKCLVCNKENCLTCKAIHENQNCKQYQDGLKSRSRNDIEAKQTQRMLEKMVEDGEAMHCPQCLIIVQKKGGCDWIKCSICKTEICWVTKGPRWGPLGEGDTSGGCMCRINGKKCHPLCINCH
ncbi:ranBP-type and C3HC4-type zinc finger-containing protein 1-like [Physella acuta]|uniref:ranBP-type and C3HC4-type zinc finger-containing protein 1-like n=1 Tax=Physella acuta TaxID=109671 RepID=UPI0027DE2820|nr:ranBP-type and C3HC4-type zinc finger-containing protein 1-like [Physella acuta]